MDTAKLLQFVAQWEGKPCGDKQCVALFRQYIKDVLGLPEPGSVVGAVNFWNSYDTDPILNRNFDRIGNTLAGIPAPGDIVIWGTGLGVHGHISIVIGGNTNNFLSFDQNWPVGASCLGVNHDYKNVLGWLSPKIKPTPGSNNVDWNTKKQTFINFINQL